MKGEVKTPIHIYFHFRSHYADLTQFCMLYMVFPNLLSLSKTHDNVDVPYRKL